MLPEDVTRKRLDGVPVPRDLPGPVLSALVEAWNGLLDGARRSLPPEGIVRLEQASANMRAARWRLIPILLLLLAFSLWAIWQ